MVLVTVALEPDVNVDADTVMFSIACWAFCAAVAELAACCAEVEASLADSLALVADSAAFVSDSLASAALVFA